MELGGLENDVTSLTIAVCRESPTGMQAAPQGVKEQGTGRSHSCKGRGQREEVIERKYGRLSRLLSMKNTEGRKSEEKSLIGKIATKNYGMLKRKSISLDEGLNSSCSFLQGVSCF